jgi:hypothetical protein
LFPAIARLLDQIHRVACCLRTVPAFDQVAKWNHAIIYFKRLFISTTGLIAVGRCMFVAEMNLQMNLRQFLL